LTRTGHQLSSSSAQFSRDLAAKISALLADPDKARRFGDAGRKRAEEKIPDPPSPNRPSDFTVG